jgi:hypothetical protein
LSLPVLLAAALAPAVAGSPMAGAAPRPAVPHAAAPIPRGPLTVAQAAVRARATGKPVVAAMLTTATSQTTALPDGELELTESLLPVRMRHAGTWVPLNPALHQTTGGRLTPQAASSPLSVSAGGNGPLAVLYSYGRTLTLTWPGGQLPAPVISGATATYPNVEPGIDLAVTATGQGDISEVLIIHSAAAAASPALATALQLDASAPGMTITAAPDGSVNVATGPQADPAFNSPAPRIWDSAAPPAGTPTGTINGVTVVSPSGLPEASTISAPGAYAHVFTAAQAVSGDIITVAAPAASLTGAGLVYPVYVDPNWGGVAYGPVNASAWTQIDSGIPTEHSDWMEGNSYPLQVGYCDPNNFGTGACGTPAIGVTRTMFQFPLPPNLPNNTGVNSANISLDNIWQSPACAAEPIQLWTTPTINSSTDWSNSSSWPSKLEQVTAKGFGNTCVSYMNDISFGTGTTADSGTSADNLANSLAYAIDHGQTSETFGLRAVDESTTDGTAWLQWRQFAQAETSGHTAADITLKLRYHYPPKAPKLSTSPADCQNSTSTAPVIGNDDITVSAAISDLDGDTGLKTTANVYSAGGNLIDGPWSYGPGASITVQLGTIHRGDITASGYYHITATTTDSFTGIATSTCYFYLDLTAPGQPVVTDNGGALPTPVPLGYQLTGLTFSPHDPNKCVNTPDPCPVYYYYQIGNLRPVRVNADQNGVWTQPANAPITIPIFGPFRFQVTGIDGSANPSAPWSTEISTTQPASALPDGYFSGGSYPDLLTTDTVAGDASLWLFPGAGNGKLGTGIDIGGLGTDFSPGGTDPSPGTHGAVDWNGTQILHGDFTGNNFQDVMAYYASANRTITPGNGVIIGGIGNTAPLNPYSGNSQTIKVDNKPFCDTAFNNACPAPTDLVYAGNASLEGTATNDGSTVGVTNGADVIGIFGPGTSNGVPNTYELAMFTAVETGGYAGDFLYADLSGPANDSPDGTTDWQDYALATAQLPDAANPNGDPSNTVLFALNNTTGTLYVAVNQNPGCNPSALFALTPPQFCTVIGMPGTWTQVAGTPSAWASNPPQLASADVNHGTTNGAGSGTPEIWTIAGNTATAYAISGIQAGTPSATQEGSGSTLYPNNSWTLNDAAANPGSSTTTATDTINAAAAPIVNTGYGWAGDDSFNTVLSTSSSFIAPATNPIPHADTTPTISLYFTTTATSQVLVARETSPITAGLPVNNTESGGYNPVLYVGADGKLCSEWWDGSANPSCSFKPVNDGLWHHVTLAGNSTSQTTTLDGIAATVQGTINLTNSYFYIGAGYIGGTWPDETHYEQQGNTGYLTYFKGKIADVTFTG